MELFACGQKGCGLRALTDLKRGTFIMEYIGEVLSKKDFEARVKKYSETKVKHFYFMGLGPNEVLDASQKGCLSRFINHSCDANCETQKWIVNGYTRIGLFTTRAVKQGEELSFDYKFERYG